MAKKLNKQKFFTILYIALIVCLIAFMIWMVIWIMGESSVCLLDPIQYYSNTTGQVCYCNDGTGWFNPSP